MSLTRAQQEAVVIGVCLDRKHHTTVARELGIDVRDAYAVTLPIYDSCVAKYRALKQAWRTRRKEH